MKNMEKKEYIKPEIEVVEMAVEVPMLTGSIVFNDEEVNTGDDGVQLSNGHRRGQWGNLWYVEED